MQYTISEMAKLLGVTTHMLRYYEKLGIIKPESGKDNRYRYYCVLDTRRFNLCRMYRSMGYSLEECSLLLNWDDPKEREGLLLSNLEKQKRSLAWLSESVKWMEEYTEDFLHAEIDKVKVVRWPSYYRLSFSDNEIVREDPELERQKELWLEYLPLVRWASRIPSKILAQMGNGPLDYDYGLMVSREHAQMLELPRTDYVEEIPGGDYLLTVFRKNVREDYTWENIAVMTRYLQEHSITHFGDAFSNCIMSRSIDGGVENYHYFAVKIYS